MKLNIELIYNLIKTETSQLFLNRKEETPNAFSVHGVRLFRPELAVLNEEILYIADQLDTSLLCKMQTAGCSFLILGDVSLEDFNYLSVIVYHCAADPSIMLERIQTIFDEHSSWMEEINYAILNKQPIQDIFRLCAKLLKNPIAMFDSANTVIVTAGITPEESTDLLWKEVLEHGFAHKSKDSAFLDYKLHNDTLPFYYTSTDKYFHIQRLIAPLCCDGVYVGSLGMTDLRTPIDESEYHHVNMVQQIIEQALMHTQLSPPMLTDAPFYLLQILQGKKPPIDVTAYQLSLLGRTLQSPFILWTIAFSDDDECNYSLSDSFKRIAPFFHDDLVFAYQRRLLVCSFHPNKIQSEPFISALRTRLASLNSVAVYSMEYSHFYHLYQAYMQCSISLLQDNLMVGGLYCAKNALLNYIENGVAELPLVEGILHPDVMQLTLQSPAHGVQLMETLRAYCVCGGNVTVAAKELFIHRHTMLYRLDRIKQITHLDLETLTPSDYWQLIFTCSLLLQKAHNNRTLN